MINVKKSMLPEKFHFALSGGVDSIVFAHYLMKTHHQFKVCHFNHNYRPQNDHMVESVIRFCRDHKLELNLGTLIHDEFENDHSENYLRRHRLNYFKSLQNDIVLGHHLDDCVESYMMNCLTGTPEYLPIPEKTELVDNDCESQYSLYRPFLRTYKHNILKYAHKNKLWDYVVEDETNTDIRYRRNWIRQDVLPQFEHLGLRKIVLKKYYEQEK